MSIQQGTIAAKIVGINQTKNGLSSVLEQWGEEVPQTFAAYPNAFNSVFENLDEKIDAVSSDLSVLSDTVEDLSDSLSDYARTAALSDYVLKATSDTQFISTPLCDLKPLSAFELNAAYGTNSDGMLVSYGTVTLNNYNGDKTILFPARTVAERVGRRIINVAHKPEIQSHSESLSTNYTLAIPYENGTIATKQNLSSELSSKADISSLNNYVLSSSLATVASTGSYNDLTNKPTIPTVNNGTLTIQKNGSNVQTFTANQSSSVTANISVPTKTSELTNDSGFLTAHQDLTDYAKKNDLSVYALSDDLSNYLSLSGGYETGIISSDFSCVSAHIVLNENDESEENYIEADVLMYSPYDEARNYRRMKYKALFTNIVTHGTVSINFPSTRILANLVYDAEEQMPSYKTSNYLIDYEINSNGVVGFYFTPDDNWDPYYGYNLHPVNWTQCAIPSYLATSDECYDIILKNTTEFLEWQQKRQVAIGNLAYAPVASANVNLDEGIAIGYGAKTYKNASNYADRSIAIGANARANTTGTNVYDAGIAIGRYAYAGTQGICIGNKQSNYVNGSQSISIGGRQAHTGNNSVQIGWQNNAAFAYYNNGIFIGNNVQGRADTVVIGHEASSTQPNNVAVGRGAYANGARSVSMGFWARGTQSDEVCIGYYAQANAVSAMQFGQGTNSTANTVQFRDKTVLSGDNMTVVKERLPDGIVFVDDLSEALSGYVDLSSNQTVGGDKHFTGKTTFESEYGADGDDHAYPRFQGANPAIEVNGGSDYAQLFTNELDLANSDGSYTSYAKDKIAKYDANFLETAFYLPSVAGNLVVNGQVNTAIGTINTNFTNLKNAINGNNDIAYLTKNTLNSGWSIYDGDNGTANRLRLYHYGKFGYIFGTVKSTSVLNANTTYTIGTLNLPSGYAFMAASMGSGSTDIVWGITAGGSLSVRSFVQRSANTNLGIRIPGLFLSTLPAVVTVNTVGTL